MNSVIRNKKNLQNFHWTFRFARFSLVLALMAMVSACEDDSNGYSGALEAYQNYAVAIHGKLQTASGSPDAGDDAVTHLLSQLTGIRTQLAYQCDGNADCPIGAGLDGEYEGDCLNYGEVVHAGDMIKMALYEDALLQFLHTPAIFEADEGIQTLESLKNDVMAISSSLLIPSSGYASAGSCTANPDSED